MAHVIHSEIEAYGIALSRKTYANRILQHPSLAQYLMSLDNVFAKNNKMFPNIKIASNKMFPNIKIASNKMY